MARQAAVDDVTILVVDDDAEVRELVAEYLRDFGYQVHEAASAARALDVLAAQRPLHLVITDIRMPEMSGLELAEQIMQQDRTVKIIFMSGYFSPHPISQPFLRKPFRLAELETAVKAQLSG